MASPIDLDFDNDVGAGINPLKPLPPTSGVYGGLFQPLFGTMSQEDQQEVWNYFLTSYHLTDPPPQDAATQALFQKYASDVYTYLETQIIARDNFIVNLPLLQPPTTGFYADAFNSYFADKTVQEKQKLWAQFLYNNHFTTTAPPEDPATMKLFMDFLNSVLGSIQNENVHSPEEIKKRYIMAQTLDSLQKMLASLQDSIGTESRNLILYGTWQQEYTKMMARVPTYVGEPDSTVRVPPTLTTATMDNFTFGYDKISVSDIADWWAANTISGTNQPFVMSSFGKDTLLNDTLITVTYTPQVGATPGSITWLSQTGGSGTVQIPAQPAITTFTANPAQSQQQLAFEAYSTAFKNAFISAWNGGLSQSIIAVNATNLAAINVVSPSTGQAVTAFQPVSKPSTDPFSSMQLPWGFGYVVPSAQHNTSDGSITVAGKLSDDNAKQRSEINAKLQAVIENIRGRRKTIQNLAQRLQTDLDQSRTTVTAQSDLLNSILQSISDLVKGLFRK